MLSSSIIINNLAGLLVVTSLMVVTCKKATTSALLYAVQSAVLVLSFIALAGLMPEAQGEDAKRRDDPPFAQWMER